MKSEEEINSRIDRIRSVCDDPEHERLVRIDELLWVLRPSRSGK
jgi:hypothetical protein